MDFLLLINIIIALGIVLSLTKKYVKVGLAIGALGFLAQAVYSYSVKNDLLICIVSTIAAICFLYELAKSIRIKDYHFDKKTRILASVMFVVLGVWQTTLGTLSPYLVAGIVAAIAILLEPRLKTK